jgi:tRNA-specific 2-thiouridylase
VFCNRFVKFYHLKEYISKQLGIQTLATGHYARVVQGAEGTVPQLLRGVDPVKDQSYFLSLVKGSSLRDVLMPLGDYCKSEVRQLAAEKLRGLSVLRKKESMGVCFIGKRSMPDFLSNYIPMQPGR